MRLVVCPERLRKPSRLLSLHRWPVTNDHEWRSLSSFIGQYMNEEPGLGPAGTREHPSDFFGNWDKPLHIAVMQLAFKCKRRMMQTINWDSLCCEWWSSPHGSAGCKAGGGVLSCDVSVSKNRFQSLHEVGKGGVLLGRARCVYVPQLAVFDLNSHSDRDDFTEVIAIHRPMGNLCEIRSFFFTCFVKCIIFCWSHPTSDWSVLVARMFFKVRPGHQASYIVDPSFMVPQCAAEHSETIIMSKTVI